MVQALSDSRMIWTKSMLQNVPTSKTVSNELSENMEYLTVHSNVTEQHFVETIYPLRIPVILRGFDIGSCCRKWSPGYLSSAVGSLEVKSHVTTTPRMDFVTKNFAYKTMSLATLISRASSESHSEYFFSENEKYYLRSLGSNPRKDVANVKSDFSPLMDDLNIPNLFPTSQFFSSVFRIGSAGIQMWTHYDVMDNILMQIQGQKRVVLFSPKDALNMYLIGDKSQVLDIDEPDLSQFPDFIKAKRYEGIMNPGDILFIPAMWFHNTLALNFNVAINVFWKHLDEKLYDSKDIYGNKDFVPAAQALQFVEKAIKKLDELPAEYKDFYGRRLINEIQNRILKQKD